MGLTSIFKQPDINRLASQAAEDPSILLLDVRTDEEYRDGHIPGSVHLELARASEIASVAGDREQKLYVYCHSGSRSARACSLFKDMGYTQVKNIGGIASWRGTIVKGGQK